MHFGWYFGLYFGFFTSELISDAISDAVQICGMEVKKNISVGSILDPGITVLTCQLQHLVLYSFSVCIEYSATDPIGVSLDQADFQLRFCCCKLGCRTPLCSCLDIYF